jgi:hypothetical protein
MSHEGASRTSIEDDLTSSERPFGPGAAASSQRGALKQADHDAHSIWWWVSLCIAAKLTAFNCSPAPQRTPELAEFGALLERRTPGRMTRHRHG